jgi:LysR family transcriptional regulator, hydrogen peroxide-inducible genes activator
MTASLPSLRQLEYLSALADTRNFTRAAQRCFVTQSTLSAGIQELERGLDAHLVERDRQHVLLTPIGEEVVERGRALLAAARDLADTAAAAGAPMSGLARLGAIPTIAPFLLPGLVRDMRRLHPALRLALREDQTERLLEDLRTGRLDFVLIALPWETAGLRVRVLFDEALSLVSAPAADPQDRRGPARVGEIDPQRLLLLEEGHCLRAHTLGACGLAERANPSGIEASSLVTLVQMVESGFGDALLPQMAIESELLARSTVSVRGFEAPAPTRTIALVARATTTRSEAFEHIASLLERSD